MSLIQSVNPVVGELLGGRDTIGGELGAYYVALTPTPGTGIIGHAAPTTFDQTKAYFALYNPGPNTVYPLYLRLHDTVISAGATGPMYWTQVLDTGNRYSSGGTAITPNNTNYGSANKSLAVITVGAATCTANTTQSRTLANHSFRGAAIDVVQDRYEFQWGVGSGSSSFLQGATYIYSAQVFPVVVVPPNCSFLIHEWQAAQSTGPTMEVEFAYIER